MAVFGAATPVDTASRDREVEERIQKEKEELEQLAMRKEEEEGDDDRGDRKRKGSEEDRGGEGRRRGSQGDSRDRGTPRHSARTQGYGGRGNSKERYGEQIVFICCIVYILIYVSRVCR